MFKQLIGKTITDIAYQAMDMAPPNNNENETIILTFSDGTEFKIWSWVLDTSLKCKDER